MRLSDAVHICVQFWDTQYINVYYLSKNLANFYRMDNGILKKYLANFYRMDKGILKKLDTPFWMDSIICTSRLARDICPRDPPPLEAPQNPGMPPDATVLYIYV